MVYRARTDLLGRTVDGRGFKARSMSFFVVDIRDGERIVKTHTLRYAPQSFEIAPVSRDSIQWTQRSPFVNRYGIGYFNVSIKGTTGREAVEIAPGIRIDGASHILDMQETFYLANGGLRIPDTDLVAIVNDANVIERIPFDAIRIDWLNWGAPKALDQYWHNLYTIISTGEIIRVSQSIPNAMSYSYAMAFVAIHRDNAVRLESSDPLLRYLTDDAVIDNLLEFLDDPLSLDLIGLLEGP